jgi:hypothetical protein
MIDGREILEMALRDFGVTATINGGTLLVIASLDSKAQLESGEIVRVQPSAVAAEADVVRLEIVAGNDGDTLVINSVEYQVLAIDPDTSGGVILSLLEVE